MSSREILRALDRRGVRAHTATSTAPAPRSLAEPRATGDYLHERHRVAQRREASGGRSCLRAGRRLRRNRGRRKVGFTMLEVDGFPRTGCARPTGWTRSGCRPSSTARGFSPPGSSGRSTSIPLGVDPNYFHPGSGASPIPHGEFVFLSNFEWGERKEPGLLLKVFNDEFPAREPVRLVCKIINRDPRSASGGDPAAAARRSRRPVSFLFNREFPHYQLGSLYRSADCFVSAARGEGWDMPLMEAMACGLPAIATDWGAHTEFVHEGIALSAEGPRHDPRGREVPLLRRASAGPIRIRSTCAHLLRQVYENREEARRRGAAASREMAEKWTWDHTAGRIAARLDALGS